MLIFDYLFGTLFRMFSFINSNSFQPELLKVV